MAELERLVGELKDKRDVEAQAKARFQSAESTASTFAQHVENMHRFFAPPEGDQWPADRTQRPNKLHITANIIKAFCEVEARLLSLMPRFTNRPLNPDLETRRRAELVEKIMIAFLEATGVDLWLYDLNLSKSIYGLGVLHPFWNEEDGRPDVSVLEQPQNLRIGWGTSDYTEIDWAIYSYEVSPLVAARKYPGIELKLDDKTKELRAHTRGYDHTDPLNQKHDSVVPLANYNPSEYEGKFVQVWDYWYVNLEGVVCNATLVQGSLAKAPVEHPELPIVPYIPIEGGHEPGNPMGSSTALLLVDLQMALNRILSSFAQDVWDHSGPSFQLTGENADSIPEGMIPKAGEVVPTGVNNEIQPISKPVANFQVQQLVDEIWEHAYRLTGLGKILFGEATADESGRARTIQIEAAANRIDPKRRRLYDGLKALLLIWAHMIEKKSKSIDIAQPTEEGRDVESKSVNLGEILKGMTNWRIVAPEMTPRDSQEKAVDMANRVNASLMPLEWAIDELGIENPQEALALIRKENSDPHLRPEKVQAFAALMATLQALAMNEQAQAMANAGTQAGDPATAAAQRAQPTLTEDMNQPGTLPATGPGSPPPAGASSPLGGQLQQLIRQTPGGESQAMSQIALSTDV